MPFRLYSRAIYVTFSPFPDGHFYRVLGFQTVISRIPDGHFGVSDGHFGVPDGRF